MVFYSIRVAKVTSVEDVSRQGGIWAKLVGADEDADPISVFYTTPYYAATDQKEQYKFTGLTALPGVGTYILICINPDDKKWYYLTTITGGSNYSELDHISGATTGGSDVLFNNTFPTQDTPEYSTYSHDIVPQKYTFESPKGGMFQISDSANETDNQWFTKLESMTNKKVIANDTDDFISMGTEHGDSLRITGTKFNEKDVEGPSPGPRSVQLQANQNIWIESDSGTLNGQVLGGFQINIQNKSRNDHATRRYGNYDSKTGEVNLESYANSVNIVAYGKEAEQEGPYVNPKGVFIDASQFSGTVQIRAGTGGVEVFSNGDIDFNCAGNFNVNAAGDINLKGNSGYATKGPTAGTGDINLNPPTNPGNKPKPSPNNDESFPK